MMEFLPRALDLAVRRDALRTVQFDGGAAGQSPVGPAGDRHYHLQIAQQFGDSIGQRIGFALPLRFQEQLRLLQNPLADGGRSLTPGRVELSGFAAGEAMSGQGFGHGLAVLRMGARHRHQVLHGYVGRDHAAAHLLLHALRQQFHQGQPARYPTQATIKAARQLLQPIAKTPLQFRQQPAFFQRRRPFRHAERTIQHQRLGLTQRPDQGLDRVSPQLLQRRQPLVAVDHQVTLRLLGHGHDDDRRLLPRGRQRGQQPPLSLRPPHPQLLPAPLQLMKLQSHRPRPCCSRYRGWGGPNTIGLFFSRCLDPPRRGLKWLKDQQLRRS